jgi:ATP-binding cassette subfamily B protein
VALLVDGRIAAVGTHSQLMATMPAYQDLLASRSDVMSAANDSAAAISSAADRRPVIAVERQHTEVPT